MPQVKYTLGPLVPIHPPGTRRATKVLLLGCGWELPLGPA